MSIRNTLALLLLIAIGGCGVEGRWTLKQVRPAVGNEGFTLARASFYPNHSFEAIAIRDGKTIKSKGTYDYCCCKKKLTLHMGGETRVYRASRESCVRLHIEETTPDGVVTAVMCRDTQCDLNADCRDNTCDSCSSTNSCGCD